MGNYRRFRCRLCQRAQDPEAMRALRDGYVCVRCDPALQGERRPRSVLEQEALSLAGRSLRYGLTPDDFRAMYDDQEGKCALCLRHLAPVYLHIDHCHETGAVRGLLCVVCNTALGKFHDDIPTLQRAIAYLERGPSTVCDGKGAMVHQARPPQRRSSKAKPPEPEPVRKVVKGKVRVSTRDVKAKQSPHRNRELADEDYWYDDQIGRISDAEIRRIEAMG